MTTLNELRSQADEIASAGHAGWGNTMRDAADEIDRLRTEAVAADIRIANDALVIAGLTAERDALARCKLADQDAYVAMRDQRDAALADAKRYRWLCENGDADGGLFIGTGRNGTWGECGHSAYHYKEHADAAIDKAMKGEQP